MKCPDCPFADGCRPPLNERTGHEGPERWARCWLDSIPGSRLRPEIPLDSATARALSSKA